MFRHTYRVGAVTPDRPRDDPDPRGAGTFCRTTAHTAPDGCTKTTSCPTPVNVFAPGVRLE